MSPEREPTAAELAAMAYVDGELGAEERVRFEQRMLQDRELAREVAELSRLAALARHAVGPEPMDAEWTRLAEDPLQRAGLGLGLALLAAGVLGLVGWLALELARSGLSLPVKLALAAALLGVVLLFLVKLRARVRTLPYDPYREVRR